MDCSVPLAPDEADVGSSDNHSIMSSASEDHFHLGQRPGSSHLALSTSLPNSCSSVSLSSPRSAMAAMPASWVSQRPQPQPYQHQHHQQQHQQHHQDQQHQQHQQYQHQYQSQSQHQSQHIPHHRHSHSFHGYHGQHLFGGGHHHQSHHSHHHHHDHHHPPVLSRVHTSPLAPILHTGQLSPASTDDLMDMVIDETPPSSSAAPPMVHSASSSSCNTTNTGSWSAAEYGGGPVDADDDDNDHNINDDEGDDDDDDDAAAAAAAAAAASEVDMHWEPDSDDVLAVTKLEPLDDDFILDQLKALPMDLSAPMAPPLDTAAAGLAATSNNAAAGGGGGLLAPVKVKRPRGRPRKHPLNTVVSSASKVAKGRSKTGCITCRRRKKKCDEAKPRCMNCEKNAVYCEGYHEKQIWKSGKERAEEERRRRESLPTITIQPLFHAVETTEDWIFWRHYFHHLSGVLTVEGEARNAFKDMVLMLANRDRGLMHSILAVSGRHIDLETPYGLKVLSENPTTTREALQRQADHHQEEALAHLYRGMERPLGRGDAEYSTALSARYGQMICLLLQTRAEGNPRGEHRVHLRAYQKLVRHSPPEDPAFLTFISEFFRYHIYADELIWHPDMGEPRLAVVEESFRAEEEGRDGQESEGGLKEEEDDGGDDDDDDGNEADNGQYHPRHHHPLLPPPALNSTTSSSSAMAATTPGHEKRMRQQRERKRQQRHPPRLLGVFDGLFDCLTQITTMRNSIRSNMARGVDPAIDYKCLWRAAEIDTAIREWRPRWPAGDSREKVGLLYQQVMWVYLFRTVYPPSPPSPSRSPSVEAGAAAAAAGTGSASASGATPLLRPLSPGTAAALATPLHTPSATKPFSATARPATSASSRRCSSSSSSSSAPSSPASPSPLSPPYSSSSAAAPAQRPFPPATPISPAITCATTTTRPSTSSSVPPPPSSRSLADDIDDTIDDSSRPSSPPPFRRPAHHDRRVTNAVEESLGILESFKPSDPAQTLLLIPCLVIGTAAFDPAQRVRVAGAVRSVKGYTGLRSCDRVTELLDEVWGLMEEGDWVAVWDWQGVARRMKLDFLCA